MKRIHHRQGSKGFTLFEAMMVLLTLLVLAVMILPKLASAKKRSGISCVNNLKQIGLSFQLWAEDHDGNFPWQTSATNGGTMELVESGTAYVHFLVMSNELSTPQVLICTSETNRIAATNWLSLRNSNLSYFAALHTDAPNPQALSLGDDNFTVNGLKPQSGLLELSTNSAVAWLPTRHVKAGNIGLADGSVQQVNSTALQALVRGGGVTNRLAMP